MFHASTADEVLFGGAAGGGKSKAVVMEALLRCLEHPGTQAYLFRRTLRELDDTLVGEALRSIPAALGSYSAGNHDFRLVNGSVMRFRYCMSEKDKINYQGAEIHWLFVDELTHFDQSVYDYLKTRLRARKDLGIHPVVRCTSNPGGPGHAWVKKYFVDAGEPGSLVREEVYSSVLDRVQVRTRQYIPSRATDNPYLSQDYIFELERKPRALREALLMGRWDAFEGQVFSEFCDDPAHYADRRFTHVIKPFDIPPDWPRYRSFDFGYARPFSVGWWAMDCDGVAYRYREWYGARAANEGLRISPVEIGRGIRRIEAEAGEERVFGVADPSIWDTSRGESIYETALRYRVYFQKGDNRRIPGWMQMHYRLSFDEEGYAQMYIFNTCRAFLRTVPALLYSDTDVEDLDTHQEDHVADESRYFCMSRPIAPRRETAKAQVGDDPLNLRKK
jgi:hypothetical protein